MPTDLDKKSQEEKLKAVDLLVSHDTKDFDRLNIEEIRALAKTIADKQPTITYPPAACNELNILDNRVKANRDNGGKAHPTETLAAAVAIGYYINSDLAKKQFPKGIESENLTPQDLEPLSTALVPKIKACRSQGD